MVQDSMQAQRVAERRVDIGAQVGIQRNREFASGGRTHRLSPDPYRTWRPLLPLRGAQYQLGEAGAPSR
jgi:hypothetical protein